MKHLPLYEQIYRDILENIEKGIYKVGDRLPSEKELSEKYEVSRITSTKAFEMLVEDGMVVRIAGKGTFVAEPGEIDVAGDDYIPAAPKATEKPMIGVIFDGFGPCFGEELLKGIGYESDERGYTVMFRVSCGSIESETQAIDDMKNAGVAGIIIMCVHDENYNANLLKLVIDKFPVISVDRRLKGLPISYVGTDNEKAAVELTNYMLDRGRKYIAFATPKDELTSTLVERYTGYAEALRMHGMVVDDRLKIADLQATLASSNRAVAIEEDKKRIKKFIKESDKLDAFFATEHDIACIIYQCLKELKLEKKYPIICFDSIGNITNEYHFTHVKQSEEQMGRTSVRLLDEAIAGESDPQVVLVPHRIIESTDHIV